MPYLFLGSGKQMCTCVQIYQPMNFSGTPNCPLPATFDPHCLVFTDEDCQPHGPRNSWLLAPPAAATRPGPGALEAWLRPRSSLGKPLDQKALELACQELCFFCTSLSVLRTSSEREKGRKRKEGSVFCLPGGP